MKTIKIKVSDKTFEGFLGKFVDVELDELRRVIKENPEVLQEEKKPFAERMIGKEYWMINSYGRKAKFIWNNSELENDLLSVNNIYWTESDCDKEISRRKALSNILSYIRDNEIELVKDEDWGNEGIHKLSISGWNNVYHEIYTTTNTYLDMSQFSLAFYSQEDREKVISNCAKDLEILLKK